ncbi:hypothetical protein FOL47_003260 [Perkinsus chesapeaki]|uniref:Uncharacterized protein n=1 Tax=Perkinsus chesapeaki TaxID=330153 RepID=A0A7J6N2Q9_PERCH|nr:hypothetical protein FOL47_003260 [Perkinsus chesapeaki]
MSGGESPRRDSVSTSGRYGNKWYDYQSQLKRRYGPGADLLMRMGYVPNVEDDIVHANPNRGRRGLGYSPEDREGPAFRRGRGDILLEDSEEKLGKCHWNVGDDHFTHAELAAVPYAEEQPLTTLSDDEGLPIPAPEELDFIRITRQDNAGSGEKKRGRGLGNRKAKKAAKLQKKLQALEKRRQRSKPESRHALKDSALSGSVPTKRLRIALAQENSRARNRSIAAQTRALSQTQCNTNPCIMPAQKLELVKDPEEFAKEAAPERPYRGFGYSTAAVEAAEGKWKAKRFDTFVYRTAANRSARITQRLLQYEDPAIVFVVAHEALHVHLREARIKIPYELEEALADWVGLRAVQGFSEFAGRTAKPTFTPSDASSFIQRMEQYHAIINHALSRDTTPLTELADLWNRMISAERKRLSGGPSIFVDRFDFPIINNAFLLR